MIQIKLVGDIWSGKYQPALTGNRIVDTALLTQFCTKLMAWFSQQNIQLNVKIEHDFNLANAAGNNALYLIDSRIANAFSEDMLHKVNFLPIKHLDLLHGDPSGSYQSILERLKMNLKLQQS